MLIAAYNNQPKYPPIGIITNELCCIYVMEYYSGIANELTIYSCRLL